MDVTAVARSIGLVSDDGGQVFGTIAEEAVLASISDLAVGIPGYDDVFADAAMRVQLSRSAGVQQVDATSVLHRARAGTPLQLRYRSEMADVFTDLAIDIGLRRAARLAETPA